MKIKLPKKEFFKSRKFMLYSMVVLLISAGVYAGGTIIFNAGDINGEVTIADTTTADYDILVDGEQCPTTITDILTMTSNDLKQVQHNIKNNENFPVDVEATVLSTSTGLTVNLYDGTMTPTTIINIPANSNKWLIVEYVTDGTVSPTDVLTSTTELIVTPS